MLLKITDKGNGRNYYDWWKNWEVEEIVKKEGSFYLAHLENNELILDDEPLNESEFYLG